jgi:hypothetical protein
MSLCTSILATLPLRDISTGNTLCRHISRKADLRAMSSQPGPHDYNAIRNTISLYCIALDTKDWALLEKVFEKDVVAIYPFNDEPILGVDALSKRIQQR